MYNSAELNRVDVLSDSRRLRTKVHQLTGRSKPRVTGKPDHQIMASMLNDHYADISTDADYAAPGIKLTANNEHTSSHITEWRVFRLLDSLKQTATGLDNIPAWFTRTRAPVFAESIADMMNLSLSTSSGPRQWKQHTSYLFPKSRSHSTHQTTGQYTLLQSSHG